MKKQNTAIAGIIATLLATAPAPVLAENRAGFRLTAVVNTICRLEFRQSATPQSNNVINLGSFTQLCNARSGYRVTMLHPTDFGGAILSIDGRAIQLSNGSETVIVDETHPVDKISFAQLDVSGIQTEARSFSFRIEPKGAVYGSNRSQANYVVQRGDAGYGNMVSAEPMQNTLATVREKDYETRLKESAANYAKADFAAGVTASEYSQLASKNPRLHYDEHARGLKTAHTYDDKFDFGSAWAISGQIRTKWPFGCYDVATVGQDYSPDPENGTKFYAAISVKPLSLEHNILLSGLVIEGMEHLSGLSEAKGQIGLFEDADPWAKYRAWSNTHTVSGTNSCNTSPPAIV